LEEMLVGGDSGSRGVEGNRKKNWRNSVGSSAKAKKTQIRNLVPAQKSSRSWHTNKQS